MREKKKMRNNLIILLVPIMALLFSSCEKVETFKEIMLKNDTYSEPMTWIRDGKLARYCSASHIEYKGKVFVVTNRHCCKLPTSNLAGHRLVGNTYRKVLLTSPKFDLCVLESDRKEGLKVASKGPSRYDKVAVIGYSFGRPRTLSEGLYVHSEDYCLNYGGMFEYDVKCAYSYVTNVHVYPGNSGSPMFNEAGEVIGIVYAKSSTEGVAVPLQQLKLILASASKK